MQGGGFLVVFLDVVLTENFIVNFFLLNITARTAKLKTNVKWCCLSAALGSMYVLVYIFPHLNIFSGMVCRLLMGFIMVVIAFGKRQVLLNVKLFVILLMYTVMLAGLCVFLEFYSTGSINGGVIYDFSHKKLMLSVMIIYLAVCRLIAFIKDRRTLNNLVYQLEITIDERKMNVNAFLDTGNELREPVTNLPVIVVERSVIKDIPLTNENIFFIPFRVVNGANGNLTALKPDSIKIYMDENVVEVDAMIGITDTILSRDGDFNALLSRGIL